MLPLYQNTKSPQKVGKSFAHLSLTGLCVASAGMYTPPTSELRNRQYSYGRGRYDMRRTSVIAEFHKLARWFKES